MKDSLVEGGVLVIGLGRFGSSLAESLERSGHEVLAVDSRRQLVQTWSGTLTHVVQADSTSEEAMRQVGAKEFAVAVVAIGDDVEASILTVGVLVDMEIPHIWAKAITRAHGRILERVGAHHVVYPERDAGARVAHLLSGKIIDYIEFDDGYAITKVRSPRESWGRTLAESQLRSRYGVTVVGVKRRGEPFTYAQADTAVEEGDLLIVAATTAAVERFAAKT